MVPTPLSMAPSPLPKRRWPRTIAYAVVGLVALFLIGDFGYSRYVAAKHAAWESTIERDANGVTVDCAAYTTGDGDDALLLVHGVNSSPRCWDVMVPALVDAGYTCRVMRLPGFCEPLENYAAADRNRWQQAVAEELVALRGTHQRVGVVAHSLGGAVAVGTLLPDPDAAEFVALLAPAVEVSSARSPLLKTRTWHTIAGRLLWFTSATYSPFGIDVHDPTVGTYPGRTPFTPRTVIDQLFMLLDENNHRRDAFRTPMLMVLTKADRVIEWQAAATFFEQVPASPKRVVYLPNSGHELIRDYDWRQACNEIVAFAAEVEQQEAEWVNDRSGPTQQ